MSAHDAMKVTELTGQVCGCEGLYVMDAAAFPTAVGVNPSATIAAIAEYKVERFIHRYFDGIEPEAYKAECARLEANVEDWIRNLKRSHQDDDVLDPLANAGSQSSPRPKAQPLGLTFREQISGMFSRPETSAERSEIDWLDLSEVDDARQDFEQAERLGNTGEYLVKMDLLATIDDLDRFLRVQRAGMADKISLSGTITIRDRGAANTLDVDTEASYLQFFCKHPASSDKGPHRKTRFFRYHLVVEDDNGGLKTIEAAKVVRDDTRFDVWQDLSTLYADIFDGDAPAKEQKPLSRGIMRLAPIDFFDHQLQSIKVTPNNADLARRSWAYAAFIRFFSDELASVYMKRRGLIKEIFQNLLDPAHGV